MSEPVFIYALCDPESGAVRYVGQTVNPAGRYFHHITPKGPGAPRLRWIAELKEQHLLPSLRILERVNPDQADQAEQRWIAHYVAEGAHLVNTQLLPERIKGQWKKAEQEARTAGYIPLRKALSAIHFALPVEAMRQLIYSNQVKWCWPDGGRYMVHLESLQHWIATNSPKHGSKHREGSV